MWLELIQPHTKATIINTKNKKIFLVHPHFPEGSSGYRRLIKAIANNQHKQYFIEATGMITFKGLLILKRIFDHLIKLKSVDYAHLNITKALNAYVLTIKFK